MVYGSICSGIEATTVAWHPLGWRCAFFAEIARFPCAVLKHHWPKIPNFGDFRQIVPNWHDPIDLLVGGTPCQSFSVAGLRAGLADDRGNLALEFLLLARRERPRWVAWENVPGVLSTNGGRDFGAVIGGLVELGYGVVWRVLDAQYVRVDGFARAVPQRRRRVFVVGYLGDWRRAAAVLFERACLLGDSPPGREAGQSVAGPLGSSAQDGGFRTTDLDNQGAYIPELAWALQERDHKGADSDTKVGHLIPEMAHPISSKMSKTSTGPAGDEYHHLLAYNITPSQSNKNYNARKTSHAQAVTTNGNVPIGARGGDLIAFDETQITHPENRCNPQPGDPSHPLVGRGRPPTIALTADPISASENKTYTHEGEHNFRLHNVVPQQWRVRRLTPRECERLQGFPDDYTDIFAHGPRGTPDGPRYKALGNSMAVNVMRWIGTRIAMVEALP